MGFLKNLLNPVHAIKMALDPIGGTISAVTGSKNPLDPAGLFSKKGSSAAATAGAPGAGTPGQVAQQPQAPLTMDQFPASGFARPEAASYLQQALGIGPNMNPGTSITQPSPLANFGNQDFTSMFQHLLTGFAQSPQIGQAGGPIQPNMGIPLIKSMPWTQPGTPGPAPNPLAALGRYAGPLGNGGGYFGTRRNAQPITIKSPKAIA